MMAENRVSVPKTRTKTKCPVFGTPHELSAILLPTYESVMKYYLLVKHELKPNDHSKDPAVADIAEKVATNIERVWLKSSIPVVSHKRVLQTIRSYHDKYMKLIKPLKGRQHDDNYRAKIERFREESRCKLFDIAACKCVLHDCRCKKERKVPVQEREFLQDQRTLRIMCMSTVDAVTTRKLLQRQKRKTDGDKAVRPKKYIKMSDAVKINVVPFDVDSDVSKSDKDSDSDSGESIAKPSSHTETTATDSFARSPPILRRGMPALARACDRHGISDRSAAAVASAVLEDLGLITASDSTNVIDQSKVRRERKKTRDELCSREPDSVGLRCLGFDGRKDKTIVNTKEGSKYYRRTIVEEHVSLIEEPGSKYIGHISPCGGSATKIKQSIMNHFTTNNISVDKLVAIGCDGTNVNTGRNKGIIRLIEEELGKPLQWLVCQLHGNELPLRHLLEHLDGSTTGPRAFSGPIGKALSTCQLMPVVAFEKVCADLPTVDLLSLSTDQKYLWEITNAISCGVCSPALAQRQPGTLNHSRWLTTANRVLRLYASTLEPSEQLKALSTYIVRVYVPVWFSIKTKPSCKDGARHLWRTIHLSRYLPDELKQVIDPVLQRNGFFGHPENLLLAMITDERKHVRELGLRRILKARSQTVAGIRKFTVSELNFDSSDYIELIDWQNTDITEPPLIADLADSVITDLVKNGESPIIDFPRFPCHTQAVERCVKLVTQASAAVCGQASRDGFIRSRLESRRIMATFNTKADYCVA